MAHDTAKKGRKRERRGNKAIKMSLKWLRGKWVIKTDMKA